MHEMKKWVAVTEDGNGKIRIFHKFVDEEDPGQLNSFQYHIQSFNVTILAMFRQDDVTEICGL